MFGPRDLYRPGETVILNGLLRDSDGKPLPDQPVKLDVLRPDGQVARTIVVQPENGLYRFNYPLDSGAQTGMWHIRANTGDNLQRLWDFHVEDFMPERMALNLSGQKRRFHRRITWTLTWSAITCMAHRPTVILCRASFPASAA
jgi:uncharacterized protein YfaS (alpha-2-macroglobulin family)